MTFLRISLAALRATFPRALPLTTLSLFLALGACSGEGTGDTGDGDGDGDHVNGAGGNPAGSGGTSGGSGGSGLVACNPTCGAGQTCVSGVCTCGEGTTACGAVCANTLADGAHCGGCNMACTDGLVCSLGNCSDSCALDLTECGTSCVDLLSDAAHCGGCTLACSPSEICDEGECTATSQPTSCEQVTDACPVTAGLTHACVSRFALGINYAWNNFGADFGGLSAWGQNGVSAASADVAADLNHMGANGAKVVRWWMFPDFRGDGVVFDGAGDPSGLSTTAKTDILTALDLAEAAGVELVLTIFSFDNFRPTRSEGEVQIRGMSPMVTDAGRRAKLVSNVVTQIAQTAATSPNLHRLLGWDIINEPEWAVSAEAGAPPSNQFEPNSELSAVTLSQMKALINESAAALKAATPGAQVSVGWAAAKWAWAFSDVTAVDFHQPHIYGWVNTYWPYTSTPAALGYTGKPTVMGEYYLTAMPFENSTTFNQIVTSWFDNGYAGAWSWQYNENASNIGLIKTFADAKGCSVDYEQ